MMSLETLKNNWESLAERDALYAILTDNRRAGGKWNVPEFMATGEAEMETVMDHLAGIGYIPNHAGKALDFGCGVGRVTQALAPRFTSCVGVDISQQMIDKAKSLNRYAHCRYVANSAEQLPFADASFSFIYSNIVLQHVPRRFSTAYLREFVRVLAPGGILVFGVQDSFAGPFGAGSTGLGQDRGYSIHKHGCEGFQWKTCLFAAGARVGLCWQTVLR